MSAPRDTVFGILKEQAGKRPEAPAIESHQGPALTHGELFEQVSGLAKALTLCGVERNARIAIVLPNGAEMAVALLAVSSLAASVPLNPVYRKEEFRAYFSEMKIAALLTRCDFPSEARAVAEEAGLKIIELSDDGRMTVTMDGRIIDSDPAGLHDDWASRTSSPDDIAMVLLTSGSTGRSKKVPLSNRNVCVATANICRTMELTPADRCLCMWEQFHVGGLVDLLLVPLASGGTVICAGSFDAGRFYAMLESARPTWFQGVPTTLNELLVHARRNDVDPKAAPLRFIRSVAAPLSVQLMGEIENLFEVPVIQTLGMTEAAPLITTNLLPPNKRKPGSVGKTSGPEIRIVGPDWSDVPHGEPGEVIVRGDNVFSGYEDAPEANAHSFRDGWFRTGDTGYFDEDDYLFLTGRLKEMINRGGEKITPQEIDDVLLSHPQIAQAASFSIEHRTLGEDVAAAIVLKTPGAVSENDVRAFVGEHLADFKVPRKILILDEMPRDPIGKVNRASLANLAATMQQAETPAPGAESETQRRLSDIWAEELGLKTVGIDDNFFELGGDSLSGVRLVLAVQEAFGRLLPASVLASHATVRDMASLLEGDAPPVADMEEDAEPSDGLSGAEIRMMSLVMGAGRIPPLRPEWAIKALNPGGARKPLVWCFNSPDAEMSGLQPHLDPEQPLIGLFSGSRQLPNTDDMLDRVARYYAGKLAELYPDGGFSLGGNCQGARVAHRIAKILLELGQPPEHLCFLEYFDAGLFDYPGKLMLMYGKHSKYKAYRPMRWGMPGWQERFRNTPTVAFVTGKHGRFFRPQNAGEIANNIACFLDDRPLPEKPFEKIRSLALLATHKIWPLFALYALEYKVRTFLVYGSQRRRTRRERKRQRVQILKQHG